jgi:hypothetical protein
VGLLPAFQSRAKENKMAPTSARAPFVASTPDFNHFSMKIVGAGGGIIDLK